MPTWFYVPYQANRAGLQRHWLISPGFSGNLMLLTWSVMGGLLVLFALSLWREKLLMPMYEDPVDTAEDVLKRGLIPYVAGGTHHLAAGQGEFWIEHMRQSDNPVYQQLAEIAVICEWVEVLKTTYHKLQGHGTHVYINFYIPEDMKDMGKYYFGKELLEGVSPYTGWIVNKRWPLNEQLARHILRFQQV